MVINSSIVYFSTINMLEEERIYAESTNIWQGEVASVTQDSSALQISVFDLFSSTSVLSTKVQLL